jgi:hypothetical protein
MPARQNEMAAWIMRFNPSQSKTLKDGFTDYALSPIQFDMLDAVRHLMPTFALRSEYSPVAELSNSLENDEHVHHYQRGRASIMGLYVELRESM